MADEARASIRQIADDVLQHPLLTDRSRQYSGLPGGLAGIAVFFGYLARVTGESRHRDRCVQLLDRCIEIVAEQSVPPSLHGGFVGTAWALHHLTELLDEGEDQVEEIDEVLAEMLKLGPWEGDYDLIQGLVGFAVYGLDRLPRPTAHRILESIVGQLHDSHERTPDGATWFTRPELLVARQAELHPDGFYNLGLAHGVPGVIGVLGPMVRAGVSPEVAAELLAEAVRWVLAQQLDQDDCRFPYNSGQPDRSRVAWCYGDPGVAVSLWLAGDAVKNDQWCQIAVEVAAASATRTADAGVVDASLCHGSAGLGLIYQRFFQYTGQARFADAARRWFAYTLEHRREGGVAGYPNRMPDDDGFRWVNEAGFLTGAVGVGLALLGATSDLAPDWDRSLLVSVRG